MTDGATLDLARSALMAGDAARARALLVDDDDPRVHEVLGRAAYLDLDFAAAGEHWQRAYAGFRATDDRLGPFEWRARSRRCTAWSSVTVQ